MYQPAEPPPPDVLRFSPAVRAVRAATGLLVLVCILAAAVLDNGSVAVVVGPRGVVRLLHLWSGYALPAPLLAGLLDRAYRGDLRRLDPVTSDDWRCLRSRARRDGAVPVGRFNAGQKLNAAFNGGGIAVLLLTGTVMHATSLAWRAGSTFVHDWAALCLCLGLLVTGYGVEACATLRRCAGSGPAGFRCAGRGASTVRGPRRSPASGLPADWAPADGTPARGQHPAGRPTGRTLVPRVVSLLAVR